MAANDKGDRHADGDERGVQALWAAVTNLERRMNTRIDATVKEIRQSIAAIGHGDRQNPMARGVRERDVARARPDGPR
ncbi:hypothetical protein L484_010747 [Morus notabilis]|uniref:Uncharacterized protein n=1 Tax=Morus notabilis TaxID=981085 RepID=W9SF42_9ROSA|nr:hypothetical protein L484_010747 [Morus notabilis]